MTYCTRILGTTAALIIAGGATADLQYGEAILNAESTCFTGSDQEQARQKVRLDDMMEVNAFCGGGGTGAYLMADPDWFVMSAGSTVPGHDQQPGDKGPTIVDGGNGQGSVEIEITVDQTTLFRMSRCLQGSKVIFWDGNDQIAELAGADAVTKLPQGSYWATIETDLYGTPVWAEVDWYQQTPELDPADVNGDGKVNASDLAALVKLVADAKPESKPESKSESKSKSKSESKSESKSKNTFQDKPSTGGECTHGAKDKGNRFDGFKPMPKPKPGQFNTNKDKGEEGKSWKGDDAITNYGDQLGNGTADSDKFNGSNQTDQSAPQLSDNGDLNNDGKIDIKDIVFLMDRL